MNDIARHLRVHGVAEHVESVETLKAVRGIGVHFAQGNYFSPPTPRPTWNVGETVLCDQPQLDQLLTN